MIGSPAAASGWRPLLSCRLRLAGAASPGRDKRSFGCGLDPITPGPPWLVWHVVEGVGVVGAQEMQGGNGNYHDQHDHSHEDFQDRSDHHTIPLMWPGGGASQTRAAIYASLPLMCKHPR
jgi:hypothetical protein